ncbi:enhancer of mRNA-decapping protein 1-like [Arachis duranensis]|uniref:Enhancer of mRNA-decapping protein 1-like n=1 Tax=Arachis duranensis TaxID=130453 RepID=A0A9C6TBH4_ARADU|nr:enhancer of mRNA-decapping protein 1-like [Arachis duranensis]
MEAYKRTYCFNVNPVKGQDLWEKTPHPSPTPPPVKPKPGRPTKKRRRDKEEQRSGSKTKMKRKYNPIRCMYCGEVGHNKRGCAKKKAVDAEEHARQMQLQLAVVTPAPQGSEPQVNPSPTDTDIGTQAEAPMPSLPSPTQADSDSDSSDSECIPPTQEPLKDQLIGRPAKLQVIKRKARSISSPKHIATGSVAVTAETIKGTSSGTAKRLEKFMTFVPTPGFKAPRKNDDKV